MAQQHTAQSDTPDIPIKGIRDGLLVSAGHLAPPVLVAAVAEALRAKQSFFSGSQIAVDVGQQRLNRTHLHALLQALEVQKMSLWAVLSTDESTREAARELGLATRLSGSNLDLNGNLLSEAELAAMDDGAPAATPSAMVPTALLVRETLRSGRSVYYEGDVVIIGDINPGAEVIAGGHVIVWGRLRGLVHAGALGDTRAMVCALDLTPTQLRIADQIAITPAGRRKSRIEPEQAFIHEGQIVAELWPPSQ